MFLSQMEPNVRVLVGGSERRNVPEEIVFPVRRPGELARLAVMAELLLVAEMTSLSLRHRRNDVTVHSQQTIGYEQGQPRPTLPMTRE